jgi:hypothetical protein
MFQTIRALHILLVFSITLVGARVSGSIRVIMIIHPDRKKTRHIMLYKRSKIRTLLADARKVAADPLYEKYVNRS